MVAVALAEQRGEVFAQSAKPVAAMSGADLIVVPSTFTSGNDSYTILTIVDPKQRVLGVYRINLSSGRTTLESVRNIQWDLQINDLNTDNPLPLEIKSMLDKR
jgi:hypothetical protein